MARKLKAIESLRCRGHAGETKIRRHLKIRREANPFDPQWRPYFAERAFRRKFGLTRQQAGMKPS
jgi:RNA-directed DNA polymerase